MINASAFGSSKIKCFRVRFHTNLTASSFRFHIPGLNTIILYHQVCAYFCYICFETLCSNNIETPDESKFLAVRISVDVVLDAHLQRNFRSDH